MAKSDSVIQRVIDVKNTTRLPFRVVAETVNEEMNLTGDDVLTKDSAQKIYRTHYRDPNKPEVSVVPTTESEVSDEASDGSTISEFDEEEPNSLTDEYRAYFGDTWSFSGRGATNPGGFRHIVAVGDFHGRVDKHILGSIIDERPDVIIIGGDSLDSAQANPHKGDLSRRMKTLKQEVAEVRASLQTLIDQTQASIWIMDGNHDKWLWKMMKELLPEWALEFFKDPIDMILEGLPESRIRRVITEFNVHYPSGDIDNFMDTRFLFPLGDALLSHMNFCGKHAGAGVTKLGAWVDQWHMILGLPDPALLIQFHGHKIGQFEDKGGFRTLVEPGMGGSLSVESYKAEYNGSWLPGNLGFVVFDQYFENESWRTDTSSVQLVRPRRRSA